MSATRQQAAPISNIEAFRQSEFELEWDEGKREIIVRHSEGTKTYWDKYWNMPPDILTSLTLGDIWRLIRKGYLEDGDRVTFWQIDHKDPDGTTYYRNPPSNLNLSEVRARIRLLRRYRRRS